MATHEEIPVVEVHRDNFHDLWPSIILAVKTSTFIALDLELSGLGDRKRLNSKSIEDRYKAISEVAQSRSVLSIGLSCFKLLEDAEDESKMPFLIQTFNIMLLCSEDYVVEPKSLQFLVDHGFDFNRQYAKGIPYYRGSDLDGDKNRQSVRYLLSELIQAKKPIIFHNALVDLIFMYYSFYCNLPATMPTFVTDMHDMFPAGIFDTKYVTEFKMRFQASYLEYVFRKSQRENRLSPGDHRTVTISFPPYTDSSAVSMIPCDPKAENGANSMVQLCQNFAAHGWCSGGSACKKSHNLDLILDQEDRKREEQDRRRKQRNRRKSSKRQKRSHQEHVGDQAMDDTEADSVSDKLDHSTDFDDSLADGDAPSDAKQSTSTEIIADDVTMSESEMQVCDSSKESIEETEKLCKSNGQQNLVSKTSTTSQVTNSGPNFISPKPVSNVSRAGTHRAGFDAFMTGFIFSHYLCKFCSKSNNTADGDMFQEAQDVKNKICLSGKDFPLLITRSEFSKSSKLSDAKLAKLFPSST